MIKAIIIDDEKQLREVNRSLLTDNFPQINIVGEADGVESGISLIQETNPDIVLLDIEINGGTGFNILQKVKSFHFKTVFITAFDHFAIKAFKFSAIDYILKPVNEVEFINAIESAIQQIENKEVEQQISNFFDHYEKRTQSKKIVLRTLDAMHLVEIANILYCKSDNSYTTFFLKNNTKIMVSKTLKEYTEILESYNFFRPHQSYLVNLNFIEKVDKTDGGFLILTNKEQIPISSRRKQAILKVLDKM